MTVPISRALVEGHRGLAARLPEVRSVAGIPAYRAAATLDQESAASVAARRGLAIVERTLPASAAPVTVLLPPGDARLRLVFLHGGGLIAGDRASGIDVVARHAAALGAEVWSVEYPLAPEHRFDAMIEVVVEAVEAAAGLPVILAGQSGGGGLAAAAMLACRDRGIPLLGQLLICPMLGDLVTRSGRQFANDPSWGARSDRTAWGAALEGTVLGPPSERSDLGGLAPTFLDTGSAELFRDGITAFAGRLWAAGSPAELHVWSGAFHASDCVVEDAAVSVEAHRARGDWMRRLVDDEV